MDQVSLRHVEHKKHAYYDLIEILYYTQLYSNSFKLERANHKFSSVIY